MVMSFIQVVIWQIFIKCTCLAMLLSVGSESIDDFCFIPYDLLCFPDFLEHLLAFYLKYAF